ncbi:putative RNA polymerase sigma factor FecI [compost metagenome]
MRYYNELTDSELVVLLKAGDNIAFTEIYNRYHGKLYIHLFNKLQSREDCKDILHDLFISLWQNHIAIEIQESLAAYLYTAVRYKVFDRISRNQLEKKYLDSIERFVEKGEYITDHRIREKLLIELIDREVAALPEKMRTVFKLSRNENLTHRQIADQLGISEQTVKKQVHNALKILRIKLGTNVFYFLF